MFLNRNILVEILSFKIDSVTYSFMSQTSKHTYITQVCADVTEIQCDILPYTECEMGMQGTPYKLCVPVQKNFTEKGCKEIPEVRHHQKMMPECRNVTKQNCVTKWETDENGKQVSQNFNFTRD